LHLSSIEIKADVAIDSFNFNDSMSPQHGYDSRYRMVLDGQNLSFVNFNSANRTVEYTYESRQQRTRILRHLFPFDVTILDATGKPQTRHFGSGFERIEPNGTRFIYSGDLDVAEGLPLTTGNPNYPITSSFVTRWPLVLEIAPGGDALEYAYVKMGGTSYLSKVSFAGSQSSYQFHWQSLDRRSSSYRFGYRKENRLLYTGMRACFAGQSLQTWTFDYESIPSSTGTLPACDEVVPAHSTEEGFVDKTMSAVASIADSVGTWMRETLGLDQEAKVIGAGIPRLKNIHRTGGTDTTVQAPTLTFHYSQWQEPESEDVLYRADGFVGSKGFGSGGNTELFDVNRDGLLDIISNDGSQSMATLNEGARDDQGNSAEALNFVIHEYRNGSKTSRSPRLNPGSEGSLFLRGDLNGDGWPDLLEVRSNEASQAFLQQQDARQGFVAGEDGVMITPYADEPADRLDSAALRNRRGQLKTLMIDVSGDGKDDLIYAVQGGQGAMEWAVLINTTPHSKSHAISFHSRRFAFPFLSRQPEIMATAELRFVDMNQDGLVDLIRPAEVNGTYGICVYHNLGQAHAPSDGSLPLFEGSLETDTCATPQFFPLPSLEKPDPARLVGMWLLDINGDGEMDFADLGTSGRTLNYWLGHDRGDRYPIRQELELSNDSRLNVDPSNLANTIVLDWDQDGSDEIVVFDTGKKEVQVIDFNRRKTRSGTVDRLPSNLLLEAGSGDGGVDRFRYTTSVEELRKERGTDTGSLWMQSSYPNVEILLKKWAHRSSQSLISGSALEHVTSLRYERFIWDFELGQAQGYTRIKRFVPGSLEGEDVNAGQLTVSEFAVLPQTLGSAMQRYYAGLSTRVSVHEQNWDAEDEVSYRQELAKDADPDSYQTFAADENSKLFEPGRLLTEKLSTWQHQIDTPTADHMVYNFPERAFVFLTKDVMRTCGEDDEACSQPKVETLQLTYDDRDRVAIEIRSAAEIPYDLTRIVGERLQNRDEEPGKLASRYLKVEYSYDESSAQNLAILDNIQTQVERRSDNTIGLTIHSSYDERSGKLTRRVTQKSLPGKAAQLPAPLRTALTAHDLIEVESFVYDVFGNVTQQGRDDPEQTIHTLQYDEQGIFVLKASNALNQSQYFCYSSALCLSSEFSVPKEVVLPSMPLLTELRYDQNHDWKLQTYDNLGRILTTKDQAGYQETYSYKPFSKDRLNLYTLHKSSTNGDDFGTELVQYDSDGREIARFDEVEDGSVELDSARLFNRHDKPGRIFPMHQWSKDLDTVANPTVLQELLQSHEAYESFAYDGLRRPRTHRMDGGRLSYVLTYGSWGQSEAQLDHSGKVIGTVDSIGRDDEQWERIVDEDGSVQTFERDGEGNLSRIKLADEKQARNYLYDSAGKLVMMRIPGLLSKVWTYDRQGRMSKVHSFDSSFNMATTLDYSYDELDRITEIRSEGKPLQSFQYDAIQGPDQKRIEAKGYLLAATSYHPHLDLMDQSFFERDAEGKLLQTTRRYLGKDSGIQAIYKESFFHRADGSLRQHTTAHGVILQYEYDRLQDVTRIKAAYPGSDTGVTLYEREAYDPSGLIARGKFGKNALTVMQGIDPQSRQVTSHRICRGTADSHSQACPGEILDAIAMTYADDGFLLRIDDQLPSELSRQIRYDYSPRREIKAAGYAADSLLTWDYTQGGRFSRISQLDPENFAESAHDILPRSPVQKPAVFDAWGRLQSFETKHNLQWSPFNQLQHLNAGDLSLDYGYGVDGEQTVKRVAREHDQDWTYRPFPDSTQSLREKMTSIALPMGVWAFVDHHNENKLEFAIEDENGGLFLRVQDDGTPMGRQRNSPFGTILLTEGQGALSQSSSTPFRQGQLFDRDSHWIESQGRFFIPELSAYVSPDETTLANPESCIADSWRLCRLYFP
jgi:YD repeat-containing protein